MNQARKRNSNETQTARPEIKWYYQYKTPSKPHPKVKVLKPQQKLTGTYQHTFDNGEYGVSYLLNTKELGLITLKGCKSLGMKLAGAERGDKIELVFKGKGKATRPGYTAPYIFEGSVYENVAVQDTNDADSDETQDETQTDEEFSDEVPF